MRLQVWVPAELLERLTVAAVEGDRPLSREVVRRLEASFGERPEFISTNIGDGTPIERRVPLGSPPERAELSVEPRVPPELLARAVAATGVKRASEVCARERFHRSGRYCSGCGKSF